MEKEENIQKSQNETTQNPKNPKSDSQNENYSQSNSPNSQSHSHSPSHSNQSYSKERSKNSYSHSEEKPKSPNEQQFKEKPALDFLIFLAIPLKDRLIQENILSKISNQIGEVSMEFDTTFVIPDFNGCLLKIKGPNLKKKRDATQQLLEFILSNDLDQPSDINEKNSSSKYSKIEIVIMIPNGLVSMVIGTKGKQILSINKETRATIVINQPIYKMTYRTVSISGRPSNVSDAIMNIQNIMEERYNEVSKIEFECKPLNIRTSQTNVKLVVNYNVIDTLTSKRHTNMYDFLQKEFNVNMKIYEDHKNKQLDHKDYICSLQGTIENVQEAIIAITRKIKDDIRTVFDGKKSYTLKMLINKVFVTKLIGAGGCMIQEIANFSKGASIKIMSNKHDEKKSSCHDIPVCIAGGFSSVQDAVCIIIEQMECFKSGGPILKSGKSLHKNIANQFINSIFTTAGPKENEDDHIYTLKDRFQNMKKDRDDDDDEIDSQNNNNNSDNNKRRDRDRERDRDRDRERERRSKSKSKNYHYNYSNRRRSNSKEHSHSRRSRSRSRSYSGNGRSYSYNNRRDRNYQRERNYNENISNWSYEENGVMKISIDFIVPDRLVSFLIGKNGENVRNIMSKTGALINFSKEYNDDSKLNTINGTGRICNLKGTSQQNASAMQMICDLIIKQEQRWNNSSGNNNIKKNK